MMTWIVWRISALRLATKRGAAKSENIVQDTVREVDMNGMVGSIGISRVLWNQTTTPTPIATTSPSNLLLGVKQANLRLLVRKIAFKIVEYRSRIPHLVY